jgi:hypothetical protein
VDASSRQLIEALHAGPYCYVLVLTGGGVEAAARLLSVPGGSRTLLEVVVPYHSRALAEFLGSIPEQYCSPETAVALAERARDRALHFASEGYAAGVACTASLATDRPKRGDHRAHVAIATANGVSARTLTFHKDARDRGGEESVVSGLILDAMAQTFNTQGRIALELLPDEVVERTTFPALSSLDRWLGGERPAICLATDGRVQPDADLPRLLLPGSFHPWHAGHRGMAAAAARTTGTPAAFELSIANVDKAALSAAEIHRRVRQFNWKAPLWLTRAPTFVEKAALFPGVTFVVGADTAVRIVDPRYYGGSEERMSAALAAIRDRGCRFLVAGRVDGTGRYVDGSGLPLRAEFRELFADIPEAEFRLDLSSTQLRLASSG